MIKGLHAMFYTPEPEAVRAFLRDQVGLPATDVGDGWLIFDVAEGEVGCHPLMAETEAPHHEFSVYTDDVEADVAAMKARGVTFKGPVEDRGWGLATEILGPGGLVLTLYQPRYRKG